MTRIISETGTAIDIEPQEDGSVLIWEVEPDMPMRSVLLPPDVVANAARAMRAEVVA